MKKLIPLVILAIAPFFAHAEATAFKSKKPKPTIIGKDENWKKEATKYNFRNMAIIYTAGGIDTVYSRGDVDILIALYDDHSRIAAYLHIGGTGKDSCATLTGGTLSKFYAIGSFSDTMYIASGDSATMHVSHGASDVFAIGFIKQGLEFSLEWIETMGGPGDDSGTFVFCNTKTQVITFRGYYAMKEGDTLYFGPTETRVEKTESAPKEIEIEYMPGGRRISNPAVLVSRN